MGKKAVLHRSIGVLICVLMLSLSSCVFAEGISGAISIPDHITLTWRSDPGTTQTITWRTDGDTVAGQVQFMEMTAAKFFPHNARIVSAEVERITTNLGDLNIHSVTLTGLKPGTCYLYRVGGDAGWSDTHSFTTSASKVPNFKFLVFGDSQSASYDTWRTTLHQAYRTNTDAAFFTNVGDLVDVGQDFTQWNAWFDAADGVIDIIPEMPVTGNHEYYIPERGVSPPEYFTAQFKLPANGPDGLKGQVYSFDYGEVHFTVLDSQASEGERFVPAMLEREKAWLEEDLLGTDKKWKIVFLHRPPYSNRMNRDNQNIHDAFVPIMDKYHVDVVFTAHDHVYAHTYPLYSDTVADATHGTVYAATGRSGSKTYGDTLADERQKFFYKPLAEPNYIIVEVRGDTLTVKAFTQSGVQIEDWTLDKGAYSNH